MIIAIDPGAKGAIACSDDNEVRVFDMPDTDKGIAELLRWYVNFGIVSGHKNQVVYIEHTGGYRPGNSAIAAVTFARHCGVLDGVLACLNVRIVRVSPAKWMRAVCPSLPKEKKDRKLALKKIAEDTFPGVEVTTDNADALSLLKYAMEQEKAS